MFYAIKIIAGDKYLVQVNLKGPHKWACINFSCTFSVAEEAFNVRWACNYVLVF